MLPVEYIAFLKEYYDMCEAASEVQKLAPDSSDCAGTIFMCPECKNICEDDCGFHFCHKHISDIEDSDYIWIPRQRDLQEIVRVRIKDIYENDYSLSKRFTEFIPGHRESIMEQLWLMFVMKEKSNKIWKEGAWW